MKKILIVDDEANILELLRYNLKKNGFEVEEASTGEEALEKINNERFDMAILDLMLPGIDGLEVLKTIRSTEEIKNLPVIMLTAKSEEIDKVIGLELGADDYLCKPFGVHELLARMKAVARRIEAKQKPEEKPKETDNIILVGNLEINRETYEVKKSGIVIEMSHKEFELLYFLAKNRGRVFDREYLLEKVWGYDYFGETRTVDVHIRNIRKKIEEDNSNPEYVKTVRGIGYKFTQKKG